MLRSEDTKKMITCPLSGKIFSKPVIASDGNTYEKISIILHMLTDKNSPINGEPLTSKLRNSIMIKNIVNEYCKANPSEKSYKYNKTDTLICDLYGTIQKKHCEEKLINMIKNKTVSMKNILDNSLQFELITSRSLSISTCIINMCDDITYVPKNGHNILYYVCASNNLSLVRLLLSKNVKFVGGDDPLIVATVTSSLTIITELIDAGYDIEYQGKNGHRPIHLACIKKRFDVIKLLISKNCDPNGGIADSEGNLPIDYLSILIPKEYEIIMFMKNNGARYVIKKNSMIKIFYHKNIDHVKLIIDSLINFNECYDDGAYPIHYFCSQAPEEILIYALKISGQLEKKLKWKGIKLRPIHIVCIRGLEKAIKFLIENKVDIEIETLHKDRPIHFLCKKFKNLAGILVEKGVDIHRKNNNGVSPVDLFPEIINL